MCSVQRPQPSYYEEKTRPLQEEPPHPFEEEPPRSTTPVYKPEGKRHARNFDPFEPDSEDPATYLPQQPLPWGRYDLSGPPPPPPPGPPPEALRGHPSAKGNGQAISPTNGHARYGGNENTKPGAQGYNGMSPTKAYPDRKRKHDEDNNEKARRQADDVTPRLKKNQPKVADAYR